MPIYEIEDLKPYIPNLNYDITIITLGRLSSLAALSIIHLQTLQQFPEIIVMGGVFFKPGNVTALAEVNFTLEYSQTLLYQG